MRTTTLVLKCVLFGSLSVGASAEAPRMEAYGDSITAAFLSGTDVTNAPPLSEMSGIISDLAMYLLTRQKRHAEKHHAPNQAWPVVLAADLGLDPDKALSNHAVSGARTWEIYSQVRTQAALSTPAWAFFFAGHNDVCNHQDTLDNLARAFSREMLQALREWDRRHVNSTAFLLPVSDIHRVFLRLSGYVWHRGQKANYSCEDSWTKFFPFCPSHYHRMRAGQLEAYMVPRLEVMNEALERLATKMTLESPSNRFVYLADTHEGAYEPEYFAVDCFHLSARGQREIADQVRRQLQTLPHP